MKFKALILVPLLAAACSTPESDDDALGTQLEVTEVIVLQWTEASDMATTLQEMVSSESEGASLAIQSHPSHNALLVRGSQARIDELKDLVARLDVKA